jgi:predicted Zn-dependent protease with MMP-like domain
VHAAGNPAQRTTIVSQATKHFKSAMNHDEFEDAVFAALGRLPGWVREAMENIELIVLDEADAELDPDGEGLLGLYVGLPLPERGTEYAGELPDVIYLFRHPHLELGLSREELRDEIEKTLIHEIAHYFGIDDDHLDEIGWG